MTRKIARMFATTRGTSIFHGTCTQDQCANGSQNDRALSILRSSPGQHQRPRRLGIKPEAPPQRRVAPLPGQAPRSGGVPPPPSSGSEEDEPLRRHEHGPESVPSKLRAFIVAGRNPLVTMPDSNALGEASKLDLVVVYEQFMTETAKYADYVLPALNQLEVHGAYNYNVCHLPAYLMLRPALLPLPRVPLHPGDVYTDLANRLELRRRIRAGRPTRRSWYGSSPAP